MTTTENDMSAGDDMEVIDLNVGGIFYSTTLGTLAKDSTSYLAQLFGSERGRASLPRDRKGRYFIDRDGTIFRFVLDYLRMGRLVLPEGFAERDRLKAELTHFQLHDAIAFISSSSDAGCGLGMTESFHRVCSSNQLQPPLSPGEAPSAPPSINGLTSEAGGGGGGGIHFVANVVSCSDVEVAPAPSPTMIEDRDSGHVTLGYRGTFAFGRDGVADVKFRKLTRILVCGRVSLCRLVFGETLNESRDPDRGLPSRYTSRFYLKHASLEHAFDMLQEAGFKLLAACASGTSTSSEAKTGGLESDESKWNHYNEFVFCKP